MASTNLHKYLSNSSSNNHQKNKSSLEAYTKDRFFNAASQYSSQRNQQAGSRYGQKNQSLEKFIQKSSAPFSQKSMIASLSSTSKLYEERRNKMQQSSQDQRKSYSSQLAAAKNLSQFQPAKKIDNFKMLISFSAQGRQKSQTRQPEMHMDQNTKSNSRSNSINFSKLNNILGLQSLIKNKSQSKIAAAQDESQTGVNFANQNPPQINKLKNFIINSARNTIQSQGRTSNATPVKSVAYAGDFFRGEQQAAGTQNYNTSQGRKTMVIQTGYAGSVQSKEMNDGLSGFYTTPNNPHHRQGHFSESSDEEKDSGVQILGTKETVEKRISMGGGGGGSNLQSTRKPTLRHMMKKANQLETQLQVASRFPQHQVPQSKRQSDFNSHSHSRRMTMNSSNSQFTTVKSRIYDHLQPPRDISPVEKRDVLEQFINPENLVGLKAIKAEIQAKCEERDQLENLIRELQQRKKDLNKSSEGIEKGNKLAYQEFTQLYTNNEYLTSSNKTSELENEQLRQDVRKLEDYLEFTSQFQQSQQADISNEKNMMATISNDIKQLKQLISFETKARDDVKGQVLIQRKQMEVLQKKIELLTKKQQDFKIGTNQSIFMMSQTLQSTSSKSQNTSKFMSNRAFQK